MENYSEKMRREIRCATDEQLGEITQAVILRYKELFPDWEVMYLAIRKDPQYRAEDIGSIIRLLQGMLP